MIPYNQKENDIIQLENGPISCFTNPILSNIDYKTVESFGDEWNKFAQFSESEIINIGNEYFDITNDRILNEKSYVLDLGCGSGRWSKYVASKVKFVEAVDPSQSVIAASYLLKDVPNVRITQAGVDHIPFGDESFDFAFSLGVLHHIPNTQLALNKLAKKVKIGGHILIYLYYNLDNRSSLYKFIFKTSNLLRLFISTLPKKPKHIICDFIALSVYLPLIGLAKSAKFIFGNNLYKSIPLSYYVGKSLNIIRNDALDRFGTPLEQRFTKIQITELLIQEGFGEIKFSDKEPYWHVIGKRVK